MIGHCESPLTVLAPPFFWLGLWRGPRVTGPEQRAQLSTALLFFLGWGSGGPRRDPRVSGPEQRAQLITAQNIMCLSPSPRWQLARAHDTHLIVCMRTTFHCVLQVTVAVLHSV